MNALSYCLLSHCVSYNVLQQLTDLSIGKYASRYDAAILYLCGWIENRIINMTKKNKAIIDRKAKEEGNEKEEDEEEEEGEEEEEEEEEEEDDEPVLRFVQPKQAAPKKKVRS